MGGWQKPVKPPPTNEQHWLSWAREGYAAGKITFEEFEQAVDDALAGRPVHFDGAPVTLARPLGLPPKPSIYVTELR